MFSPQTRSLGPRGRGHTAFAIQRGPAQALCERRTSKLPSDPGTFCAALLGPLKYDLPQDVHEPTWQVALRHFAQARPTKSEFRRLLERRTGCRGPESPDPGVRVAACLLREWERYGLAQVLGLDSADGRRQRRGTRARRGAVARLPEAVQLALRGRGAAGPSRDARETSERG
jgi:hypothetical protein